MLSEGGQTQKAARSMIIFMKCPEAGNPRIQEVDGCQGLEGGDGIGETDNGHGVPFWGDENVLALM